MRVTATCVVALVVPGPQRGEIPLDPSQYRPLRRPVRKFHCSDLPCRWRCHEVTVGSFRYLVRARPEPPSACGISPRSAGGEEKWRLRAGLPRGRCRSLPLRRQGAEGEGARALHGAALGASPSAAARQLPLGGSIGSILRCATAPPAGSDWESDSADHAMCSAGAARVATLVVPGPHRGLVQSIPKGRWRASAGACGFREEWI